VTDFASAMGLAAALRMGLINAAREKVLAANQETAKNPSGLRPPPLGRGGVIRGSLGPIGVLELEGIGEG
jgi:hypothetical protein